MWALSYKGIFGNKFIYHKINQATHFLTNKLCLLPTISDLTKLL